MATKRCLKDFGSGYEFGPTISAIPKMPDHPFHCAFGVALDGWDFFNLTVSGDKEDWWGTSANLPIVQRRIAKRAVPGAIRTGDAMRRPPACLPRIVQAGFRATCQGLMQAHGEENP